MTNTLKPTTIGVISAGSWGTALAIAANRAGSKVTLYSNSQNVLESVVNMRTNVAYLPDVFIDPSIDIVDDFAKICESDIIILAAPSQHIRSIAILLSDQIDTNKPIIIATKGIERGSLALMSEVVSGVIPKNPIAILSGPNFAIEVAKGLPTATTIACASQQVANNIIYAIGGKFFRPYYTDDIIGVQIGGAAKNVIAIACGIAIGCGFGENAKAAIITRGLAEIHRLCIAKGGKSETLMGLSGFGDLVLTCGSEMSRNMSLGIEIGRQREGVKDIIENRKKGLAEGVATSDSITELSRKIGVSMPICNAVRSIIYDDMPVSKVIASLLERQFVAEISQTSF